MEYPNHTIQIDHSTEYPLFLAISTNHTLAETTLWCQKRSTESKTEKKRKNENVGTSEISRDLCVGMPMKNKVGQRNNNPQRDTNKAHPALEDPAI